MTHLFSSPTDHATLLRVLNTLDIAPAEITFDYLGESILGRPIPRIRIGHGHHVFFYVGAHHGMEWITSTVLLAFLREFEEVYQHSGKIFGMDLRTWCQRNTLFLIPMLNPDGVEYQLHGVDQDNPLYDRVMEMNRGSDDFSSWQANARGVDLNHNYDAGFWEYKKLEAQNAILPGPTRYSGEHPASEPEVAALSACIEFHSPRAVLTLHTQGEEIFFQSGGTMLPQAEPVARKLTQLTGYRLSQAEGLASYGGLTDWCIQRLGISAFTLECGKGKNPLPLEQGFSIYTRLRRALFLFPTMF